MHSIAKSNGHTSDTLNRKLQRTMDPNQIGAILDSGITVAIGIGAIVLSARRRAVDLGRRREVARRVLRYGGAIVVFCGCVRLAIAIFA